MVAKFENVEISFTDQSGNESPGLVVAPEDYAALKAENAMLWAFVFAWDRRIELLAQYEHVAAGHANTDIVNARNALDAIQPTAPPHTPKT